MHRFFPLLCLQLDIKLSTENAKPGAKFSIKINTTPNSFVSLLGVDQSVTLLGSGNDIDKSRVASDMNAYNVHENFTALTIKGNKERYLDFGESNAFVLTNALEGDSTCLINARASDPSLANTNDDDEDESGLNENETDQHNPDKPKIRKNFPETWIFEDFEADDDGKYTLSEKVPDTITSFIVSGFAIHPENGLALAVQKKVTVMQEFFLKLHLPYSIRFGEILKVDVTVFNYIQKVKKAVIADVKMYNKNEEFEFIDATVSGNSCKVVASSDEMRSKSLSVPSGNGAATYFLIRALVSGEIKIKVRASTARLGDEVEKMLLVENEGLTMYENKPFLIDLRDKSHDGHDFGLPIPSEGIIQKSILIEASAIGDLLGPALINIHKLM